MTVVVAETIMVVKTSVDNKSKYIACLWYAMQTPNVLYILSYYNLLNDTIIWVLFVIHFVSEGTDFQRPTSL